jgi:ubiquinone/menaquinone biosynthesis C-methylase UbiE
MVKKAVPQFTGERVVEGSTPKRIWLDHVARYKFASNYIKGRKVLDISCGTGYGSKILYDAGAAKVVGVDISSEEICFACDRYKTRGLEFRVGDVLRIDFSENYFDVVACLETIEHVKDQRKALSELKRVLKPKGLLIISSPNRKLTSPAKSVEEPPNNPFHAVEYEMKECIQLLGNYFEILEVYGQRGINKLFFLPLFERIMRKLLPALYNPEKGNPEPEKISYRREYRYITVVCRKR